MHQEGKLELDAVALLANNAAVRTNVVTWRHVHSLFRFLWEGSDMPMDESNQSHSVLDLLYSGVTVDHRTPATLLQ